MKTIYRYFIAALCFASIGGAVKAQNANDTTLNRQILLEREFTPTIQDALKINTVPAINEPVVEKINFNFETGKPGFRLSNYPLGDTGSGDINSEIAFSKSKGYLGLNAGTYANINANLGYRIVDTNKDVFDVFARHNSTSGDVDYIQDIYFLKEAKAKYQDNLVKLRYKHIFEAMDLSIKGSFFNMGYNYYGNTYSSYDFGNTFDLSTKQNVNVFNIGAAMKSTHEGLINYAVSLGYHNFSNKYGIRVDDGGLSGGLFNADLDFSTAFGHDKLIGLKLNFLSQSFGDADYAIEKDKNFHSLTNIGLTPYVKIEGDAWRTNLGLNLEYVFDNKNKLQFSPNIEASVDVAETSVLYGSLTGGVNENTFLDILHENRYVDLSSRVAYSKTFYDLKVGFKSGVISGFEFDLFGGYKHTDDDHLYIADATSSHFIGGPSGALGNVGRVLYADVSTGHFGGSLKTNLVPYMDLSARLTGYFYSVKMKDENFLDKAWNRPTMTAEAQAIIRPIDKLSFIADFVYAAGRKTASYDGGPALKMKNITEFNLKGEYELMNWLSFNIQAKNILNAKYDLWRGYTQQGFSILGGVSLKF